MLLNISVSGFQDPAHDTAFEQCTNIQLNSKAVHTVFPTVINVFEAQINTVGPQIYHYTFPDKSSKKIRRIYFFGHEMW